MMVLGVIPARGGSKGVPGKNVRMLGGKPLIRYTIEAARASGLSSFIVSTDDDGIARAAREAGASVPFVRPAALATDRAEAIPVLQHAVTEMAQQGKEFDAVMMLQPTTPFRSAAHIDEAIDLLESTGADSVISVVDVEGHHPARMKYLDGNRLLDPPYCEQRENQPRQELRPMYIRNGAIYLTRTEVLMSGSLKGRDCRALVMTAEVSVNIDTVRDLEYAEWLLSRQPVPS
jgi:CMP-N,N'-diacetyllegionaminic acid synthase